MSRLEVSLDGYLSKDAEQRTLNDGTPVLNVTIPHQTSRKLQDGSYEHTSETLWVTFALFGDDARRYQRELVKGAHVRVYGAGALEGYDTRDGERGTKFVIRYPAIQVIPDQRQGGQRQQGGQQGGGRQFGQGGPPRDEPWGQQAAGGQGGGSGWATPGENRGGGDDGMDPPF